MLNNSQYTIIIQYISILGGGGGLAPPLPPGSNAYVCVSCYWCPVSCMIVNEALIYNNNATSPCSHCAYI